MITFKHTLFILDNARVHVSNKARNYFRSKGIPVLTLPPYTPEFNKVEGTFNILKHALKKQNLYKKKLEYVIAETIKKL